MNRPTWDTYYMTIAHVVSMRSIDPDTKVGCVIVTKDHSIISAGYNSPPRGVVDKDVPLTRPEKYDWMVHAEENAIVNAARIGSCTFGAVLYTTVFPCIKCTQSIINAGILEVLCLSEKANILNEKDMELSKRMFNEANVKISTVPLYKYTVEDTLQKAIEKLK